MIKFIIYVIGSALIVQVMDSDTVWSLSRVITHVAGTMLFFYFWSVGTNLYNDFKANKP